MVSATTIARRWQRGRHHTVDASSLHTVRRADIATIIGALDNLRDTPPATNARHAIDHMIHHAVTDLT